MLDTAMAHAFVTAVVPFDAARVAAVESALDGMGNPVREKVRARINDIGTIHFMSIVVVPGDETGRAHLILEATADGSEAAALAAIAQRLKSDLESVLGAAEVHHGASLYEFLRGHALTLGQAWGLTCGLPFDGTPGMSCRRILREHALATRIADILDGLEPNLPPLERLRRVRETVWNKDNSKWSFAPEPARCLEGAPESGLNPLARIFFGEAVARKPFEVLAAWRTVRTLIANSIRTFLWPLLLLFALTVAAVWYLFGGSAAIWLTVLSVLVFPSASALVAVLVYYRLRRHEASDVPVDLEPSNELVRDVMQHETYTTQNLLYSASILKPGLLRRLALRLAFWSVGLVTLFCRPGFLGNNRVIHFARWLRLPGTDQMVFLSNYDGTWKGYVGDFVMNPAGAHGVTAIWSNCVGFPRTRDFIVGAEDRDRLVRWARRQQRPVHFWYSAYPDMTTDRVRINAAIRQGLACAQSEADAADWLACFGSAPRPPEALQVDEIPALAFSRLGRFTHAARLTVSFSDEAQKCRNWLRAMERFGAWGESPEGASAAVVGLAAAALRRLGVPETDLATFPVAYQQGMAAKNRARALGDEGDWDPGNWDWGGPKTGPVDVIVLVYATSDAGLTDLKKAVRAAAKRFGHTAGQTQVLQTLPPNPGPTREAFGFLDGISQPAMRGSRRARKPETPPNDIVAPGELTLGYPDNLGRFPPTPSVSAGLDPRHLLPDLGPDPYRQRPDFSRDQSSGRRDLGRNGTYLVVRQLEQDVDAFAKWLDDATDATRGTSLPANATLRRDLIAAKAVGRWYDGTSLVRHPDRPGNGGPDNDFMFGEEDAGALRCPFGAHIRRANPRDGLAPGSEEEHATVNTHRLLRVGRSYDAQPGGNPGLLFMCVNVDIERQFEFVQGSWLMNTHFSGLERESDPLLGHESEIRDLTLTTHDGPLRLGGLSEFVRMRGGGYFFLPSRTAYRFLARLGTHSAAEAAGSE